jgi:tetratricopeptide (TPR) repeat protein
VTSRAVIAGLGALGVLGVLGAAVPASAQSKRYPPAPVDHDAEQAASSELWSTAITPERHPYQDLVRAAAEALGRRTGDQTLEAIKKLDTAIQLLPREPDAYRLRGEAHLERRDWPKCAADFAAAAAHPRRNDDPQQPPAELYLKLGICQARAGKLGDAEKTLAEPAASGNASPELWMRLGEVRIAMGKLDEAIAALSSALGGTEPAAQAPIRFLLAAAYDRARRPADALLEAGDATRLDRQLSALQNPAIPPLGAGELDYLLGLAYSADPPRPEYVLAYFRRFVKAAPDSLWRKRAEEHIRAVKAAELPDTITRGGTAPLDLDAARATARRAMPKMRACLARSPAVVLEVEISRAGPRTSPADRTRPRFFSPPDGVTVRRSIGELSDQDLDTIDRCLQPLASQLALPAVKERDTYYKAMFYVVGP